MEKLKPCPFCGMEIERFSYRLMHGATIELQATCDTCGTSFDLTNIEWWNRRADDGLSRMEDDLK